MGKKVPGRKLSRRQRRRLPPVIRVSRRNQSQFERDFKSGKCLRCGKQGPHFVAPSCGDPGFYLCDPDDQLRLSRTPATSESLGALVGEA